MFLIGTLFAFNMTNWRMMKNAPIFVLQPFSKGGGGKNHTLIYVQESITVGEVKKLCDF